MYKMLIKKRLLRRLRFSFRFVSFNHFIQMIKIQSYLTSAISFASLNVQIKLFQNVPHGPLHIQRVYIYLIISNRINIRPQTNQQLYFFHYLIGKS